MTTNRQALLKLRPVDLVKLGIELSHQYSAPSKVRLLIRAGGQLLPCPLEELGKLMVTTAVLAKPT